MAQVEMVTKTVGVGKYLGLNPGQIVEAVARHGELKEYGRLIRFLMKNKHWSPLEHVHFGFRIVTSRDISAQMIRHRSFHWQEFSQRYSEVQEFMPIDVRAQGKTNRQVGDESLAVIDVEKDFLKVLPSMSISDGGLVSPKYTHEQIKAIQGMAAALEHIKVAYKDAVKVGIAKESARGILPMSSRTVVHMTGNLRDFLGFLNVRCEAGTQKEHREIALAIGEHLEAEFPELQKIDWREGGFM